MHLTLELDKKTSDNVRDLMSHYNLRTQAEVVSKAMSILKIAAFIDSTQGELIARKGNHETKINVR